MSLLDVMSRAPDGTPPLVQTDTLTWPELARYLRETYWENQDNKTRKANAARRGAFYAGGGDECMAELLTEVMQDKDTIELRRQWIRHAKHNNVLRRAINELATVYSAPAARTVDGDDNAAAYAEMQRRVRQDEVMQRVNRLGYLHRAVFVYPRVRLNAAGQREPVLEVVTPDRFDAITHPADPTMLVAISLDLATKSVTGMRQHARLVITATETIAVDDAGMFDERTLTPHAYGRIPGVLYCVDAPSGGLFDSRATDDLESAHRAVWFENILLLKESKSATKQVVINGDVSRTARGQMSDTEGDMVLQEGTTATTLDRSMDLAMFRATARDIYETAAANHGIPPSLLGHAGTQSADARELIRTPLKELRLTQQVGLRDVERDLATVQAAVYAGIPGCAFAVDGWSIDFADPQTPLGQKEALDVFEKERGLGLTSTEAEVMRRNPDLTKAQARMLIAQWDEDETWRIGLMKDRLAASGAMGVSPNAAPVDFIANRTAPNPPPMQAA